MNNVKLLDCTLRDGGRIINCEFQDLQTKRIIYDLQQAGIDIIEVGFLRDEKSVTYSGNSTFFTSTTQISPLLPEKRNAMYVAFVDLGMYDIEKLEENDGASIDGIRLGFTKKDYENALDEIVYCAQTIKDKGYRLFLQGVNSLNYTDLELLELVNLVNRLAPYSFGIVDTYGAMYVDDVRRIYGLVDHNLDPQTAIDFHSHNNYQLSFSFAQEIIALSNGVRNVIIDVTLRGMGKGAGNANTELVVDYLARIKGYPYDLEKILEIIDLELYDLYEKNQWGYSPASFMAGIYRSHPNNIIYLLNKYSFTTNDIKNILAMLSDSERAHYPYNKIDELCAEYSLRDYDDNSGLSEVKNLIHGRMVLILAPGKSLKEYRWKIDSFVEENNPFIISVNFVSDHKDSVAFFGNKMRYHSFCYEKKRTVIVTSDIASGSSSELVISAKRLSKMQGREKSGSMSKLLSLLREIDVTQIAIAGMDGFSDNSEDNYFDQSLMVKRTLEEVKVINERWQKDLDDFMQQYRGTYHVQLITPSLLKID